MTNSHPNTLRHLALRRLSAHRGAPRLWLEGKRLQDIGFSRGVHFQKVVGADTLTLRLSADGDHRVSGKGDRPVVDLVTRELGDVERVEVAFTPGAVFVSIHPIDAATRDRLARLNRRLAAGQGLRLGSICHGGGIASDAILRGLPGAQLAWAIERDEGYLEQSLEHGALSAGGCSVEADLGDVDPRALGEVEVLEAGLPCTAASRAGKAKKHLARQEDQDDLADLVVAFLEIVRATQPAVVVLENVEEYATSATASIIRARLNRFGYSLHEAVIDGSQWALEARRRWVLVAVTRGLELDLSALAPTSEPVAARVEERPGLLGEVLDTVAEDDASWRTFAHLARKQERDLQKGNGFCQQLLDATSTRVPTLRRGYQKGGSTDPRLVHPSQPGLSRLLTPAEHARIKGIPAQLVEGLSAKIAHQVLGQSVIAPAFVGLGALIGQVAA